MNILTKARSWLKNKNWLLGTPKTALYKPVPDQFFQQPRDLPPFTFHIINAMLMDPAIRLGLAMRSAPLCSAEFAFKSGTDESGQAKWTPGIKAAKPEVGEFVLRQLNRIWQHDISKILSAQVWGWSAGEVVLRLTPRGMVEYDTILHRHARDVRPLLGNGEVKAVRFLRVRGTTGNVELRFPKSYWHVFRDAEGTAHNLPILHGAYSPFADKWFNGGALDVRRLFAHKDAYGGVDITYPTGVTDIGKDEPVPNRDIVREIAEQLKAGGVTTRPAVYDPVSGKPLWEITRATIPAKPTHIFDFPKELDIEIWHGMEIPDDVITSESGGAWQGKQVPMQAFYSGLNTWLTAVVRVTVTQIIEPLVLLNFGQKEEFEVTTKPLDVQAMEMQRANAPQGQGGEGGGQPGGSQPAPQIGQPGQAIPGQNGNGQPQPGQEGQPGQQPQSRFRPKPGTSVLGKRFALDAIAAVGEGTLKAAELVKACKVAIRTRLAQERVGKGSPEGGQFGSGKEKIIKTDLQEMSDVELDEVRTKHADKGTRFRAKRILRDRGTLQPFKTAEERLQESSSRRKGRIFENPREVAASEDAELSSERDAIADILDESGAKLDVESDSGSRYYTLKSGRQIRVSDHPPNAATKNWIEENNVLSVLLGTGGGIVQIDDAVKSATRMAREFDESKQSRVGKGSAEGGQFGSGGGGGETREIGKKKKTQKKKTPPPANKFEVAANVELAELDGFKGVLTAARQRELFGRNIFGKKEITIDASGQGRVFGEFSVSFGTDDVFFDKSFAEIARAANDPENPISF